MKRRIHWHWSCSLLLASLLLTGGALAQTTSRLQVSDGILQIDCHQNLFGFAVHPMALSKDPAEALVAELKMQVEGSPGASWAPGIYLYWESNKWIAIRISSGIFRMEGSVEGSWVREQEFAVRPQMGEWNGLRLVWKGDTVDIYAAPNMEEWQFLTSVPRPGAGLPWLIVGKGYASGGQPYLANPYSDPGGWSTTRIKDVRVTLDGELLFSEGFAGTELNRSVWVPFAYGDSDIQEKGKELDEIRRQQNLARGAELAAQLGPLSVPFSLERWAEWRGQVERPASLYKRAFMENAKRNFSQNAYTYQALSTLLNNVTLVMSYTPEQIAHMIPETTPTSTNWTPSPLSDRGFPHGDWQWSPYAPDVIIERSSGRQFPNDDFPEDIVIVATSKGKEQRLTFHRSKNWEFSGFPLATSFSGHIRACKVNYMAARVQDLGLLYAITGEIAYAKQAKTILSRFAEVYPNYLVHSGYHEFADIDALEAAGNITALPVDELVVPPNRPNRQLHAGHWMAGRATGSGMEGSFLLPVTVAYDLVADALDEYNRPLFTYQERLTIETDLLLEGTKLLLANDVINNKTISARTAVAAIGATVGDPELVRWGLDGLRRTLDEWFLADGATSESPAYGLMVLNSFWQLGEVLYGYSDPPGYKDVYGLRYDNLDIYRDAKYQAVWECMYASLLPSLCYPPIADSYTTSTLSEIMTLLMAVRFEVPEFRALLRTRLGSLFLLMMYRDASLDIGAAPSLKFPDVVFPDWRLAYLRAGDRGKDATAVLNISDWGGHHHLDSLDLYYWKDGQELLSDLGYLWDHPQAYMTRRSVAHNLVVVNESDQRTMSRGGDVELFHPLGRYKVTEGTSQAYPRASIYRRFVAQMEHPGENSYVFDVFRVQGGDRHDLVFHGPGQRFETEGLELQEDSTSLARYQFTNVRGGQASDWRLQWRTGTGRLQTLAIAAGDEQVLIADGWGQRASKDPYTTLPFVIRRRDAATDTLESRYLSLYEGYSSEPLVQEARALELTGEQVSGAEGTAAVVVTAGAHRDYLLHGLHPQTVTADTQHGKLSFQGLAGVASLQTSGLDILGVIGGRGISIGEYGLRLLAEDDALQGAIADSTTDGFSIEGIHPELAALEGHEVFVSDAKKQTAYPVRKVTFEGGMTRIVTQDHLGGFPFASGESWQVMQTGYVERQEDGTWQVFATAPLQFTLPAAEVDGERVAWCLDAEELPTEGDWQVLKCQIGEQGVQITLSAEAVAKGALRLRLR
ncbi:MAG: heparinase II/III domain-containing protein [Limnochordia bacterium]